MTPYVRLIGLTAPVHDAEDLALMGPFELMQYVGALTGQELAPEVIDVTFLIDCGAHHTFELGLLPGLDIVAMKLPDDDMDGMHDRIVLKATFLDLHRAFEDASLNVVERHLREILGVMWDMLVVDFPEVFTVSPRLDA